MSGLDEQVPSAGGLAPDDFADQYNDFSVPDPFAVDLPAAPPTRKRPSGANAISSLGLGIGLDEEVIVAKKARLAAPKFDESLLLDKDKGIPKLQERAKRLKLKGKGHEFSDCQRMLEMYQLWLNNLYPKARFLDAAAMVERLGHKSRVAMARKGWIDGRNLHDNPAYQDIERVGGADLFDDPMLPPRDTSRLMQQDAPIFTNTREKAEAQRIEREHTVAGDVPDDVPDDELDLDDLFGATSIEKTASAATVPSIFGGGSGDDMPDEDDLDALMADQEMNSAPSLANRFYDRHNPPKPAPQPAMGKGTGISGPQARQTRLQARNEEVPQDDDDLDALMAEAEIYEQPSKPASTGLIGPPKSVPLPETRDDETDDLDSLLAELQ